MVESFVNAIPKETVVSIYNAMNAEFVKFKDPILSQLKGSPSIKTREKIWDSVKEIFAVILQPFAKRKIQIACMLIIVYGCLLVLAL